MKKIVLKLESFDDRIRQKVMKKVSELQEVESIAVEKEKKLLTVTGNIDPVSLVAKLRKICDTEIVSVGPKEGEKKKGNEGDDNKNKGGGDDGKKKGGAGGGAPANGQPIINFPPAYYNQQQYHYPPSVPLPYYNSYKPVDDSSSGCVIS